MMRILMAGTGSGGEENFKKTVLTPVDLEKHADVLTFTERQLLAAKHGRFARVWGFVPAKKGPSVTASTELKPGDQVWFHHSGYVHHVAEVVTILHNLGFDRALWDDSVFPGSGFVFTVTEPVSAHISKAEINKRLGYARDFAWQGNRLLSEEASRMIASGVYLTI
jgi:hypothetical protein